MILFIFGFYIIYIENIFLMQNLQPYQYYIWFDPAQKSKKKTSQTKQLKLYGINNLYIATYFAEVIIRARQIQKDIQKSSKIPYIKYIIILASFSILQKVYSSKQVLKENKIYHKKIILFTSENIKNNDINKPQNKKYMQIIYDVAVSCDQVANSCKSLLNYIITHQIEEENVYKQHKILANQLYQPGNKKANEELIKDQKNCTFQDKKQQKIELNEITELKQKKSTQMDMLHQKMIKIKKKNDQLSTFVTNRSKNNQLKTIKKQKVKKKKNILEQAQNQLMLQRYLNSRIFNQILQKQNKNGVNTQCQIINSQKNTILTQNDKINIIEAVWIDARMENNILLFPQFHQEIGKDFFINSFEILETGQDFLIKTYEKNPLKKFILIFANSITESMFVRNRFPYPNVQDYVIYCGTQKFAYKNCQKYGMPHVLITSRQNVLIKIIKDLSDKHLQNGCKFH